MLEPLCRWRCSNTIRGGLFWSGLVCSAWVGSDRQMDLLCPWTVVWFCFGERLHVGPFAAVRDCV